MKNRILSPTLAALTALALVTSATVHGATLKVGDAAPKLQVAKWAQGDAVKEFETGKAYVVEFWATWCGPCRATIPHLNELHTKFKDKGLIVIGQNVWERDETLVAPFIKKMAENMTYRVAQDDKSKEKEGAMATTWMKAAGQNGIPAAFIVDKKGKIAWIGHPAKLDAALLEAVLADRYDPAKGVPESDSAPAVKKDAKPKAPAKRPVASTKNYTVMSLTQKLGASLRDRDWDEAEANVAELEKLAPENQRARYILERFQILAGRKDFDGAYKILSQASDAQPDDVWLQNQIAWFIATKDGLARRDLGLAEKAADRAVQAAGGKDANALDTLARIQFMKGNAPEAAATQRKAVDAADASTKTQLRVSLASYQAGKLP